MRRRSKLTRTIGIIGSGLVGKAVARLAVRAGYVVISNSRGLQTLPALVGNSALAPAPDLVEEAIAAGDIVTLSIPLAVFETCRPTASPARSSSTRRTTIQASRTSAGPIWTRVNSPRELVQKHLRGAKLVKGVHNLGWIHMEHNARPKGDVERTTLPIAGDVRSSEGGRDTLHRRCGLRRGRCGIARR